MFGNLHRKWLDSLLDLVFPHSQMCLFCWQEATGMGKLPLCRDCAQKIMEYSGSLPSCLRCGHFTKEVSCPNCHDWGHELTRAVSVVPYEGRYKEIMFDLKYNKKEEIARALGYLMAIKASESGLSLQETVVVPLPLHPLREEERGYNQSLLLARAAALELGLACADNCLRRRHYEKSQTGLGRRARRANMQKAFHLDNSEGIKGKNILLVDDILTTGATLCAAASVLKVGGAREIYGLTWAAGFDKKMESLAGRTREI